MPKKDSSGDKWWDTKLAIGMLILLVFMWGGVIDGSGEPPTNRLSADRNTSLYKWETLIMYSIVSILFVLVLFAHLLALINYLWDTWQRRHPHNRSLKPLFTAVVLVVAVIVFLYVVVNIYPFVDYLIDKIKTVTHT
tara:strand:+ start:963 stop:1373 length:411 start_codon:yes stop_codon:yes gene_type:complete